MKTNFKLTLSALAALLACAGCGVTQSSSDVEEPSNSVNSSVLESTTPEQNSSVDSSTPQDSSTPEESNPTSSLTFDTTKQVSITFYHTMNQYLKEILDSYITKFNQIYPNINITNISAGDYDGVEDQLITSISAGKVVADMAYCYPDHVALYNKAKATLVLDKYIEDPVYGFTTEQKEDFVEAYWEEGKSFGDGLMYSLPLSKSTEVMYYDADFFAENGLKVPTHWFKDDEGLDPETSMEYVCEKIKKLRPGDIPLGYDSSSNWFITLCEQYGSGYTSVTGEHYIFDNETSRNFVGKIKDWFSKGYVTTKGIYGAYTSNLFKNLDTSTSRSYISIGSSAGASNQVPDDYSFEVGVAKIPQVNQNNGKVISQGPNICILKNADEQKNMACWLLLRYLTTSIGFQGEFSITSGYSPVINSVYDNSVYQEFLDSDDGGEYITARANKVALEQKDWYYTSPAFVGSSEARDQVGTLLDAAIQGTMTIDEAFKVALNNLRAQ